MTATIFRAAVQHDADRIAYIYIASRKTFQSFAPLAHPEDSVREWIATHLVPLGGVTVAECEGVAVGLMAVSREEGTGWIDHLYLLPTAVGQGIGTQFIERAKTELGPPIRLYTFQANEGARRFYERHDFGAVEFTDGTSNEERCPDIQYLWPPRNKE